MTLLVLRIGLTPPPAWPDVAPAPWTWGHVLHGFVESAARHHAPELLQLLRPDGPDGLARFTLHAPPEGQSICSELRFGLVVFGALARHADRWIEAMARQCDSRIQNCEAWLEAVEVVEPPAPPECPPVRLHQLTLRSPLQVASKSELRHGLNRHGQLRYPSLGSVLDSIADRMKLLAPELATSLAWSDGWRASNAQRAIDALTLANDPAAQVSQRYRSTPRGRPEAGRRQFDTPGVQGTLFYLPCEPELECTLLYWVQWLGVGGKTTFGFGCYAWTPL